MSLIPQNVKTALDQVRAKVDAVNTSIQQLLAEVDTVATLIPGIGPILKTGIGAAEVALGGITAIVDAVDSTVDAM